MKQAIREGKFQIKLCIFFIFLPIYIFSQSQNSKKTTSKNNISNKWVKACLNLEVKPNFFVSKMFARWQIQSQNKALDKAMVKRVQDSIRYTRYTGTGIYLLYNTKHYIITARHLLIDDSAYFKDFVVDRIFLIQNASDVTKTKKIFLDTLNINYLDGYSSGPKNKTKYILSEKNEDLALIALDDIPIYGNQFVKLLQRRGYEPIQFSDIDTSNSFAINAPIIAFGFPGMSTVRKNNIDSSLYYWQSNLSTIPVRTKGYIKEYPKDSSFFKGDIFIHEGFSGGPVTYNNKLIGINRAYWGEVRNIGTELLNYYYEESSIFIKASLIPPLLRKLEERFSTKN
jgi:S1-C subfamily serine protease